MTHFIISSDCTKRKSGTIGNAVYFESIKAKGTTITQAKALSKTKVIRVRPPERKVKYAEHAYAWNGAVAAEISKNAVARYLTSSLTL